MAKELGPYEMTKLLMTDFDNLLATAEAVVLEYPLGDCCLTTKRVGWDYQRITPHHITCKVIMLALAVGEARRRQDG